MTQTAPQLAISEQTVEVTEEAEPVRDVRALLDHLSEALSAPIEASDPAASNILAQEVSGGNSRFGAASAVQAAQIQSLIEQVDRLENDSHIAELRQCMRQTFDTLSVVTEQFKQEALQADVRIRVLTRAVAILSGMPDLEVTANLSPLVDGAKIAFDRIQISEQVTKQTGSAIIALQEKTIRGSADIYDLSVRLNKLGSQTLADRNELTDLREKCETRDRSLTVDVANARDTAHNNRSETIGLREKFEARDRALTIEIANLRETTHNDRNEISKLQQQATAAEASLTKELQEVSSVVDSRRHETTQLQQRMDVTDQTLATGLAKLGETLEATRHDTANLQQRADITDQSLAKGLAKLSGSADATRDEFAQMQRRIAASDTTFAQELATVGERATLLRDDLGQLQQRLVSIEGAANEQAALRDTLNALTHRLEEMESNAATEIGEWKTQNAERVAGLMSRLEGVEYKNYALDQAKQEANARLQTAEMALAGIAQRQKAWHERVSRVLSASADLPPE